MHPFDTATALDAEGRGRTSAAYANMIGPYGGITGAQLLQAVMQHPQRLGEPVAFTINFAAAVADGEFRIDAQPARTNRSTQHWIVRMLQGDEVVVTATAVTAVRRDTWAGQEASMPEVPRPHDVALTPRRGVEWLHRYEMRFLEGTLPRQWDAQDLGHSLSRLWLRDNPPRPLDFPALLAAADVFFPRVWLRRAKLTPVGTVSMTVYFHASAQDLRDTGEGYLLIQARGQGFGGGYFDHAGQLWNEAGRLLATTHQVVYYKE